MISAQVVWSKTSRCDILVPSHDSAKVAGTKITVTSQSGGFRKRCTRPSTTASSRYITLAAATAPPGLKVIEPCCSSSVPATKVAAVRSENATMT